MITSSVGTVRPLPRRCPTWGVSFELNRRDPLARRHTAGGPDVENRPTALDGMEHEVWQSESILKNLGRLTNHPWDWDRDSGGYGWLKKDEDMWHIFQSGVSELGSNGSEIQQIVL